MEIIGDLMQPGTACHGGVATIGFFDGVHRGHQALVAQVRELAAARAAASVIITFAQHPRQVLQSDYVPQLLSTPDEKLQLLSALGVDCCVPLNFTPQLAALSARDFMLGILRDRLHIAQLVVGYDHHFGRRTPGEGFADYRRYGEEAGIRVVQAPVCRVGELTVSSSQVRRCIASGEVSEAARLLGRRYRVQGTVVAGNQIGRTMGFPTANLQCAQGKLLPADGVYAVTVECDGTLHAGMLNIGCRPTLRGKEPQRTAEVHLLGFHGDLYGHTLTLCFAGRVREERRFAGLDELQQQLQSDARAVAAILNV